jgi:glycosyltransferase involved in cell wall biosynthesis
MAAEPIASVVVPTHNRAALLPRLVAALEAQDFRQPFEVVVVDDGSTDDTSGVLDRLSATTSLCLVPVRLDTNGGPAQARNAGWRRARARLIAFTDDDCAPGPGWLRALVASLAGAEVVQGRTIPDPAQLVHRNVFSHSVLTEDEWGYYEACNMGYRREVLERLGGFDEQFQYGRGGGRAVGPIFGEDTDLAWRAKAAGASTAFDPNALVLHDMRRQSYVEHLRNMKRRQGVALAVKRNPALRSRCRYRVFWRPAHPSALLAAVGLLMIIGGRRSAGRLLAGIALCVPYVNYRMRVYPTGRPRNRPFLVPLFLVSDLTEMGVLAGASIRYRTFVL